MKAVSKLMMFAIFGAVVCLGVIVCGETQAQDSKSSTSGQGPRLGETQVDSEYKGDLKFMTATGEGVHAFLGGAYGSHWLDGKDGKALYRLPGNNYAESFDLVWEQTTNNYYYYYEKGSDGTEYKNYKWRFDRRNSGNNNFEVRHTRPEQGWDNGWHYVHHAFLSDLPESATLKTTRKEK